MRFISTLCLAILAIVPSVSRAQSEIHVSHDAKFVVQLDVAAFRSTHLGKRVLDLTQEMAQQELGGEGGDIMQKIEESVGFNPLEEIRTITLVGSDYENPEDGIQMMVQLGKTTGNLEGLALALPGYESEEIDGVVLHSAEMDEKAYAAVHTAKDGSKSIVAAMDRDHVMSMVAGLGKGSASDRASVSSSMPEGTFAQVRILRFPSELMEEEGPPANILKILSAASVNVAERGDNYEVEVNLSASDDKKAEQIQQLAQGMKALVGLFEAELADDDDARMLVELLEKVSVDRDGSDVSVSVAVPEKLIIEFLREEADLPL